MNVPLSWAFSHGPLSRVSLAGMHLYPPQSLCPLSPSQSLCPLPPAPEPVSSASAQEPVSPTSVPEPPSPAPGPVPTPEPRRSKRTMSIRCFSRAQPAEASQGWKCVDSYSLATRATWIQLWFSCHLIRIGDCASRNTLQLMVKEWKNSAKD